VVKLIIEQNFGTLTIFVANLIPIPSPARRRGQYIVPLLTGEGFRVRLNIRTTKIVRERKFINHGI
jgi:hypothetical protein